VGKNLKPPYATLPGGCGALVAYARLQKAHGYSGTVSVNTAASNNAGGILVINVPAGVSTGTFTVTGVRVPLAGTALTSLTANISSVGNAIVAGQTVVPVISAVASSIASVGSGPATVGLIDGGTGAVLTQPVATAREGYFAAFAPQGTGDTTSVMVRFSLSANPPVGVTITFPATVSVGNASFSTANADGTGLGLPVAITSSSASLNVYYKITVSTDPTLIETLAVPVTLSVSPSATLPLAPTTLTYTCSLAPIGNAFSPTGQVITAPIPRFAAAQVGPASFLEVTPPAPKTTLFYPRLSVAGTFSTVITVMNPDLLT
jgi:hypothetical protein